MDKKLLEVLACPVCKSDLSYDKEKQELICKNDAIAFPVKDGIPVMLENEARTLTAEERL
ncbi:Trm112 family protein [Aestuariirhabdus sp. Z084]|uniref:Trm112 family protein n=1 Tax=Aestuariirhabdus haliotis TaxID=2918751 RepID=UPI00201B3955|nr:Trm112 family protein [Aestuariirhabdus haliotis]MCL6414783.1 Trm112 family protein [Aestuariirhabdus haliotis]MCL6418715.1 Trm112 family protein [Aestuariirhabdus haliotis]